MSGGRDAGKGDRGYSKYIPPTKDVEAEKRQEQLSREQEVEIAKWRQLSSEERKAILANVVNQIERSERPQREETAKSGQARQATKVVAKSSGQIEPSPLANVPGSARWLIDTSISLLMTIPPHELTTDNECDLVTISIMLRTIQVREGIENCSVSGSSVITNGGGKVATKEVSKSCGPTDKAKLTNAKFADKESK